jgi:putative endonuclease
MTQNSIISTKTLGKFSEYFVATFLILKAYTILHMRYKSPTGEVDIIAQKGTTLVFIEVKSRKNLDLSYNIIRNKQIYRIKNTAALYLQKNRRYNDHDVRFDLIMVSNFFHIEHIKNAW